MNNITIGMVTPCDYNIPGGVQKHTTSLGKALTKLGYNIIYLSPSPKSNKLPQPHINIGNSVRVPNPNGSLAEISIPKHTPKEIRQIIAKHNIDILHFQEMLSPYTVWHWIKHSTVPNIVTFHSGWEMPNNDNKWEPYINTIKKLTKNKIDASIGVSEVANRSYKPIISNNHYTIPPAIDLDEISIKQPTPTPLKDRSKKHIVFLGRLDKRKGCIHLIKAMAHIPEQKRENIQLYIIGNGPEKTKLINQVKTLNLTNNIHFLGYHTGKTKYAYLQHADIYIAPTTHGESFGIVLIEALASKIPLIAGNNDGYKETLKTYPYQEYILDPKNHKLLATKITQLLNNKKHQQQIKAWATSFVPQFSAINTAKQHSKIYESLIKTKQQPRPQKHKLNNIAYYNLNPNADHTIFILHGHRSDSTRLLPLAQLLSKRLNAIAIDIPGSGDSKQLMTKHTIKALGRSTARWINKYIKQNPKPYSILGLSLGGNIAITALPHLKTKPQNLYLYSTPTSLDDITPNQLQSIIITLIKRKNTATTKMLVKLFELITNNHTLMKSIYKTLYPNLSSDTIEFEIKQWKTQTPRASIESMQDLITTPLSIPPQTINTTYIHPHHDDYIDINKVKQKILLLLPNTKFIEIDMNNHVPKGPISQEFFKPFTDILNSEINKNLTQ